MTTILRWKDFAAGEAFFVARSWRKPGDAIRPHTHDFSEVLWIDTGTGEQSSPSGTKPLQTGDIIFIRPSDIHALTSTTTMQFTNIAFPRDTYNWLCQRYATPWTTAPVPEIRRLEPAQLRRLNRAAEELCNAPRTRLVIERFLLNLLHMLARQPLPALPADSPEWFQRACAEIHKPEHFRSGASAFTKLAGRSAEHVARVTRALLRQTPSAVVNRVRMQFAARQLTMTDAKIMDIALDCGLTNLSHFYRLFQRQFGITPQAYRQQQRSLA